MRVGEMARLSPDPSVAFQERTAGQENWLTGIAQAHPPRRAERAVDFLTEVLPSSFISRSTRS
jgi:hypothetical protein